MSLFKCCLLTIKSYINFHVIGEYKILHFESRATLFRKKLGELKEISLN